MLLDRADFRHEVWDDTVNGCPKVLAGEGDDRLPNQHGRHAHTRHICDQGQLLLILADAAYLRARLNAADFDHSIREREERRLGTYHAELVVDRHVWRVVDQPLD